MGRRIYRAVTYTTGVLPLQSFQRAGKAADGRAVHRTGVGARRGAAREVDCDDLARLDPPGDKSLSLSSVDHPFGEQRDVDVRGVEAQRGERVLVGAGVAKVQEAAAAEVGEVLRPGA